MDSGGEEQGGTGFAPAAHMDAHRHRQISGERPDGKIHHTRFAREKGGGADREGRDVAHVVREAVRAVSRGRGMGNAEKPGKSRATTSPDQPLPLVRVDFSPLSDFSINSMIIWAMFLPVADSIPSSPGEEFTSMTTGP